MGLFSKSETKADLMQQGKLVETAPFQFAFFVERDGRQVVEEMTMDVPSSEAGINGFGSYPCLTAKGLDWCRVELAKRVHAKVVIVSFNYLMPNDEGVWQYTETGK